MLIKVEKLNIIFNVFTAFAVSLLILSPFYEYPDRSGYIIRHFTPAIEKFFRLFDKEALVIIFDQPLWLMINAILVNFFTPDDMVRVIIGTSTFLFIWTSLTLCDKYKIKISGKLIFVFLFFILVFLHSPQVQHMRQGVAVSIFMLSFLMPKKLQNIMVLVPPLIHYSFFITIVLYFFTEYIKKNDMIKVFEKVSIYIKSVAFVIIIIGLFILYRVGEYIFGTELAIFERYDTMHEDISGMGFILWSFILFTFILQGKRFVHQNLFSFLGIVMYLASYFIFGSPARLFSNVQPMVLISGLQLTNYRYIIFLCLMLLQPLWNIVMHI